MPAHIPGQRQVRQVFGLRVCKKTSGMTTMCGAPEIHLRQVVEQWAEGGNQVAEHWAEGENLGVRVSETSNYQEVKMIRRANHQ